MLTNENLQYPVGKFLRCQFSFKHKKREHPGANSCVHEPLTLLVLSL